MTTSERLFLVLLSFYPNRFRKRFGAEMIQIFRDCSQSSSGFASLWLQTLKDFASSLLREWRHEVALEDNEIDYTGLIDLFMVSLVVGVNLLGWGSAGAAFALAALGYQPSTTMSLTVVLTVGMAALVGALSARLVARSHRGEPTRIKV